MGTSIKIVFIKQFPEDDYGTLYIRTIKNRTIKKKSLQIKLRDKDWITHFNSETQRFRANKKFPLSENYNYKIEDELKRLSNSDNSIENIPNQKKSFINYWSNKINKITNHGTKIKHQTIYQKLLKFLEYNRMNDLLFIEITPLLLQDLKYYFETSKDPKELSKNTINHYLKVIKSVINSSIQDDYYYYSKNPFSTFTFSNEKIDKKVLTEDELNNLIRTTIDQEFLNKTKNLFLFQIFSNGMRVSDLFLLRWRNIEGNRMNYKMFKTGSPINLPLNFNLLEILIGIINKGETDLYDHFKRTTKLLYLKDNNESIELNLFQIDKLIQTYGMDEFPSYISRLGSMEIMKIMKELKKNKGNIVNYKGYDIENDDSKMKEYINFRESLLNKVNEDFYTYCLNLIQEHKKMYPDEFIFGVLDKTLFLKQKDNKLLETQYKQLKHSTIVYNRNLKRVQTFCKIETRLTSHVGRHTFTNQLLRMENVNLYDVSQSLGHSNIKITENYINSGFNIEKTDYLNIELSKKFKKQ